MSPWPKAEAKQNKKANKRGKIFTYQQCKKCTRWFGDERNPHTAQPELCPWVCGYKSKGNLEKWRERTKDGR